jgi:hypothetical protein
MFALDSNRLIGDQLGVLMLEPGTGQALEIPVGFLDFHCDELIEFADAALAREAFGSWRQLDNRPLSPTECVSYRVPLFLGGKDEIENMERSDLSVYWDLSGQLIRQADALPEGTPITGTSVRGSD